MIARRCAAASGSGRARSRPGDPALTAAAAAAVAAVPGWPILPCRRHRRPAIPRQTAVTPPLPIRVWTPSRCSVTPARTGARCPPRRAPVDTQPPHPRRPRRRATGPGGGPGAAAGRRRCRAGHGSWSGAGGGPGAGGGGQGGTVRPPELRDLAFPFDTPPKELRGASLAVTFWVRVDGRSSATRSSRDRDRDYARKFDEVIRAFRFTPARAPDGSEGRGHDDGHLHAARKAQLLGSHPERSEGSAWDASEA